MFQMSLTKVWPPNADSHSSASAERNGPIFSPLTDRRAAVIQPLERLRLRRKHSRRNRLPRHRRVVRPYRVLNVLRHGVCGPGCRAPRQTALQVCETKAELADLLDDEAFAYDREFDD